jgi:hypothetical protein
MLLDNNYNIFKNVEMGENWILEKYLMIINLSSILNIWKTCVEMAKILYINKHHRIMIEKLQNGEQNEWAKTNI